MNILILIILIIFPTLSHATSWKIDDLYTFTTSTNGSAGIVDADSVPTYRIYEDETGTAVLTGSMAKLDDVGTTGFYSEQVTLSAANGFEKGKSYNIIICAAISSTTACATEIFQIEMEVDSNTVSGTVPTVTNVTNGVTLANDAITAAKISADADQEIRDAMKLAPTAGAPSAGSVDEHLDDILGTTCDISAATSGLSFTIATCTDENGTAITLATDMFVGSYMVATTNSGTQCNVVGQGVFVSDLTAGVVTVKESDMPGSGFSDIPNTTNCGVRVRP